MIVYNKETLKDHDVINDFTMKLDSIYREMAKLYNQNMGMSIITPTNKVIIKDDRPKSCPRKTYKHTKSFAPLFCPNIKDVWFREPATIVWFDDGTKTTAVAGHGDKFDKEVGLSICVLKRVLGNQGYRKLMDKWCYDERENLN